MFRPPTMRRCHYSRRNSSLTSSGRQASIEGTSSKHGKLHQKFSGDHTVARDQKQTERRRSSTSAQHSQTMELSTLRIPRATYVATSSQSIGDTPTQSENQNVQSDVAPYRDNALMLGVINTWTRTAEDRLHLLISARLAGA